MSVISAGTTGSPVVQFTGLTGFNYSGVVSALVQVASEPITLLQNQVTADQAKVAAWTDVGTQLSGLASAVTNLQLQANMTGMTASSSDTGVATATATANAQAGKYTVNVTQIATGTTTQSAGALAAPVSQTNPLDNAGFALTPTAGYFTINGKQITIDPSTESLTDVINAINSAGANVTAAVDPSNSNLLQLTSTNGQQIQIGSLGDTSNFLSAANLLAAPQVQSGGQYTATSTSGLAKLNTGVALDSAGFASGALTSTTSGSFSINGVSVSYDTTKDTLNDVISRINNAGAGVVASYDAVADRVDLTATTTGSQTISLQDTSGNLLQALQITAGAGATQTLGQNAAFTISGVNGGQPIYSSSNQVTNALSNVTLNLTGTGTTTLTVGADTQTAENTVNAFVTAYNTLNADINGYLGQGKTLQGDTDLENIQQSLFNASFAQVSGQPAGYTSLAQIGITTDQNTGNMVVDSTKLQNALASNPQAVYNLFNAAAGGVATTLNNLLNQYTTPGTGLVAQEETGYNNEISDLNQTITNMQARVTLYQQQLEQEFTNMETTLASLQTTSSYLTSFISALNGVSSSSTSSSSSSSSS